MIIIPVKDISMIGLNSYGEYAITLRPSECEKGKGESEDEDSDAYVIVKVTDESVVLYIINSCSMRYRNEKGDK